jgi:hypothetical protein
VLKVDNWLGNRPALPTRGHPQSVINRVSIEISEQSSQTTLEYNKRCSPGMPHRSIHVKGCFLRELTVLFSIMIPFTFQKVLAAEL